MVGVIKSKNAGALSDVSVARLSVRAFWPSPLPSPIGTPPVGSEPQGGMGEGERAFHRQLIIAVIGLFLQLALPFVGNAQSRNIRVYFYPPWNISKLPMYMARDAGIFDRDGLQITWTNPGSNEKLLGAMKNGEADIAVISANHVAYNNASGGPVMRLVGNSGYNYSAFFAAKGIQTAGDLKGKKIGSGEPGSTPDQLTRLALRRLGIDPEKDVTLIHFDEGRNTDRVKSLLAGEVAAMMITAEAMYDLERSGEIKKLTRLSDHKQLKIYAGGGADYAMAASFLNSRRDDAKRFMSGICAGIALARTDKSKALSFVAKSGRDLDGAAVDYLYRLYITDVIPPRPLIKPEGVELAIQMAGAIFPDATRLKATELADNSLVPELEKEGRCKG